MESLSAFWKKASWADCIRKGKSGSCLGWRDQCRHSPDIFHLPRSQEIYHHQLWPRSWQVTEHTYHNGCAYKEIIYGTACVTRFYYNDTSYLMIWTYLLSLGSLVGGWVHSEPAALIHGSCAREHHITHTPHGSCYITVAYSCLAALWSQYYKPACPWRERLRDNGEAVEINASCVNAVECHTISLHAYLLCLHMSQQNSMTIHQNLATGLPLHMQQRLLATLAVNNFKDEFVKQLLCKYYTKYVTKVTLSYKVKKKHTFSPALRPCVYMACTDSASSSWKVHFQSSHGSCIRWELKCTLLGQFAA